MADKSSIIIEARNLYVGYDKGEWILENINLKIHTGETILFIGKNGTGKTTLIRAFSTLIPYLYHGLIRGKLKVCGYNPLTDPINVLKCIGYVGHEPEAQILTTDVDTELEFSLSLAGIQSREEIEKRIRDSLKLVNANNIIGKSTIELSGGETAKLVLASNIVKKPKILLLDEPTAFLDNESTKVFLETLRILKSYKYTLIIATHRFKQYIDLADRILLFKDKKVYEVPKKNLLYSITPQKSISEKIIHVKVSEPQIVAYDAWFRYPRIRRWILKRINISFKKNGIIIIKGPNGSGKTTLLKLLSGLYKPTKGKVLIKSKPIYIPQDPRIFFTYENLYMELKARGINPSNKVLDTMGLRKYLHTPIHKLSYGLMRKASLIIGLLGGYNPLYLDEPTAGIDSDSLQELLSILRVLKRNRCLVIASHDEEMITRLEQDVIIRYYLRDGSLGVEHA